MNGACFDTSYPAVYTSLFTGLLRAHDVERNVFMSRNVSLKILNEKCPPGRTRSVWREATSIGPLSRSLLSVCSLFTTLEVCATLEHIPFQSPFPVI